MEIKVRRPGAHQAHRLRVGVFSPSSPGPHDFPRRFQRGLEALRREGNVVVVALHAQESAGHVTADARTRADDLHALIRDPSIGLVMATTGGYNSNGVLPFLDLELLRRHWKPLVGFSDVTALLVGLYARAGLVSFHGPALLPQFGEAGGPHRYSADGLWRMVRGGSDWRLPIAPPTDYSDSFRLWDKDDDDLPVWGPEPGWEVWQPGEAVGPLIGGNLDTLLALAGTPYWPDFEGAIFFWEDAFGSPGRLERQLSTLEQIGLFSNVRGMIVGKFYGMAARVREVSEQIAAEVARRYRLPTIGRFSIGHTNPVATLPVGVPALLSTDRLEVVLLQGPTV